MFDNLLHQEEAASFLESALRKACLPPSLLFHGPWCSGKTTAALELARVLSCAQDARWACDCPSCERHRRLTHPDLLIMGPDRFLEEISAVLPPSAAECPKRELYAFIRAVRRLTKRFDPALWAGEESKLSKAVPILSSLEEILSDLDPGSPSADPAAAARKAAAEAAKLLPLVPQGIPISQVRAASAWSRLSPYGKSKVLILENADLMLEASRNALLKLLEEPPKGLSIVLCAERRQAIMETILSRLRPVAFRPRSAVESAQVLQRIFPRAFLEAGPSAAPNAVARLLESFNPFGEEAASRAAQSFLASLSPSLGRDNPLSRALGPPEPFAFKEAVCDKAAFPAFCRALLSQLSTILRTLSSDPDAIRELQRWSLAVTEAAQRASIQNQGPEALLGWLSREIQSGGSNP